MEKILYEYAVVRYVPRVEREEFLNIGLVMMCKRHKWLKGEISLDAERLKAFDSRINIDALQRQAGLFCNSDVPFKDIPVEEKYRWLTAVKSAVLQVSPSHPGIIIVTEESNNRPHVEVLEREYQRLFENLVL